MSIPEEALREIAALSGVALGQQDLSSTLQEICRIAARAVPGAAGASLTTMSEKGPSAVAASDGWAKGLDEMQYVEHEGPCLDAVRAGLAFRVRDLAADVRWPSYGPRAAEAGARSVLSLPTASESKILGALNVYSREPDAFSAEAVSIAEIVAAHTGLASQVAATLFGHKELSEGLQRAMEFRAVIEQAKGILMAQRKVTADAAFALLQKASQDRNVKLRLLALDVVETGRLEEGADRRPAGADR